MKSLIAVIALLGVAVSPQAFGKKKFEYSRDFAGTYRGIYTVVADGTGIGPVTAKVNVPKNGQKLRLKLKGLVTAGVTFPVNCTLRFDSRGRVRSNAATLGLFGPSNTLRARLKGKNGKFRCTLVAAPGAIAPELGPLVSSIRYEFQFKKKSLTITGVGTANDTPIGFQFR